MCVPVLVTCIVIHVQVQVHVHVVNLKCFALLVIPAACMCTALCAVLCAGHGAEHGRQDQPVAEEGRAQPWLVATTAPPLTASKHRAVSHVLLLLLLPHHRF